MTTHSILHGQRMANHRSSIGPIEGNPMSFAEGGVVPMEVDSNVPGVDAQQLQNLAQSMAPQGLSQGQSKEVHNEVQEMIHPAPQV